MMARWRRALHGALTANGDLITALVLLVGLRPLSGRDHLLNRADLLPWIALCAAVAGGIRRGGWGFGPAPGLLPRRSGPGALADRAARALAPFALLWAHDVPGGDLEHAWETAGLLTVTLALCWVGRRDGRTAWDPAGPSDALLTALGLLGALTPVVVSGAALALAGELPVLAELDASLFLGACLLGVGAVSSHPQALRQRLALWRRRWPLPVPLFRPLLAAVAAPLGLLVLLLAFAGLRASRADLIAAHVLVWAMVLWPQRAPVLRAIMLREVGPGGGRDPAVRGVTAFEAPPEGALRFRPLDLQENGVVHLWVAPVREARLDRLDDPAEVPWPRSWPHQSSHVLGQAAFEPEAGSLVPQTEELTVRVEASEDLSVLRAGEAAVRRLVVLRAWLAPGRPARRERGAYVWEQGLYEGSRQVVDGNTTEVRLRDGDLIVASSEGVARAYQVVFGERLTRPATAPAGRAPQIEDYVGGIS